MTVPMLVPDASVILTWVLSSPDEEDRARALHLEELPVSRRYRRALGLMQRHAVTFYNAVYHAVALELEATVFPLTRGAFGKPAAAPCSCGSVISIWNRLAQGAALVILNYEILKSCNPGRPYCAFFR